MIVNYLKVVTKLLPLIVATLLSANALAEELEYDANGFATSEMNPNQYQEPTLSDAGVYQIANAGNLYWFMEYVNQGGDNAKANAVLTKDIVVNENVLSSLVFDEESGKVTNGDEFREWFPIGYFYDRDSDDEDESVNFLGVFDGNGYTISGLYFNNEHQTSVGLIGGMGSTGIVKNVGIIDSYFYGSRYVGAICGDNYSNESITNCYNTGSVNAIKYVGGICGENNDNCIISNCYNVGSVSGSSDYDGICGEDNNGTVKNCYDFKVNGGTLSNEYSIEVIDEKIALPQISRNSDTFFGWYSNSNYTGDAVTSESKFEGVHIFYARWTITLHASIEKYGSLVTFDVETEPNIKVSTFLNLVGSQIGSGYRHSDMQLFLNGNQLNYDTNLGNKVQNGTTFTFEFKNNYKKNGFGNNSFLPYQEPTLKDGVYQIKNAGNLYWFAEYVNQGGDNAKANAVLTKNIVVNENVLSSLVFDEESGKVTNGDEFREWFPIGYYYDRDGDDEDENVDFIGVFDGNGYTISGLYFNNGNQTRVGLIGGMGSTGIVKNVGIIDSYFYGYYNIASVCGLNYGTIENCYNTSEINGIGYVGGICAENVDKGTIKNCYNTGDISGGDGYYIGGICGYNNNGTIGNCYNTGDINGSKYVGGVCGDCFYGVITNCNNISGVNGSKYVGGVCGMEDSSTIGNCYNTGEVNGSDDYIGGLCGYSNNGYIETCYNAGEVSGGVNSEYIGGMCGANVNTNTSNSYDFKLKGGALSEYSIVVENENIALPIADMVSLEGYEFGGWYDNADYEEDPIVSEKSGFNVHTLYAKLIESSIPTAIKAVENGGTNKTIKTIKDGQIVIIRDNVMHDLSGRKL